MHHCKALSSTGYLVLIFGCILAFLSCNAHSQQVYTAQLWPISGKLNQKTILSLLQATDGTLWIATLAGIDRYNGVDLYEYRIHKPQEGHIASSQILGIMESTSGEIYAATTDAGLLLFRESENRLQINNFVSAASLKAACGGSSAGSMRAICSKDEGFCLLFCRNKKVGIQFYENARFRALNIALMEATVISLSRPTPKKLSSFSV